MRPIVLAALALTLLAGGADAQYLNFSGVYGVIGNDTGGIIPYNPDVPKDYRDIADRYCAYHRKRARITSVHARYGDYVGFRCFFARDYDPVKERLTWPWWRRIF